MSSPRNYNDPNYKKWLGNIRKRDGYICQWPHCGKKEKTQCHHILGWEKYPTLRYIVDNGIVLCRMHHDFIKDKEEHYAPLFMKIIANRNTAVKTKTSIKMKDKRRRREL